MPPKESRTDHDILVTMEERLANFIDEVRTKFKQGEDHEKRIRKLEDFRYYSAGVAAVIVLIFGVVSSYIVRMINK